MKAFFDTSALIKRYLDEPGSGKVAGLFEDAIEVYLSPAARVEAYHVFYRLKHSHPSETEHLYYGMREMEQDLRSFSVVMWDGALENKVLEVMEKVPIKSFDAVQLASALMVKPDMFITADKQLAVAARKFPLTVVFIS